MMLMLNLQCTSLRDMYVYLYACICKNTGTHFHLEANIYDLTLLYLGDCVSCLSWLWWLQRTSSYHSIYCTCQTQWSSDFNDAIFDLIWSSRGNCGAVGRALSSSLRTPRIGGMLRWPHVDPGSDTVPRTLGDSKRQSIHTNFCKGINVK